MKEKGLQEFLGEAEELLDKLNSNLFKLSEDLPEGKIDPDTLNDLFRSVHTLKGISGIYGFQELSSLSHHMEDLLDGLRLGKVSFTREILHLLFEGVELISTLLTETKENTSEGTKQNVEEFVGRLSKAAEEASSKTHDNKRKELGIDKNILKVLTEYEEHRLRENLKEGKNLFILSVDLPFDTFDQELTEVTNRIKSIGELIATLPSSEPAEKDRIRFDLLFGTSEDVAAIKERMGQGDLRKIIKETHQDRCTLKRKKETQREEGSIKSISNTVRVDIQKLDAIMSTVGELALCKTIINRISDRLRYEWGIKEIAMELKRVNRNLEKKINYLQTSLLEARMVPLTQLFERLSRMVRRLSSEEGKEIETILEGSDTELDKLIVEELADPLMHIMRNSLDHGIESPEERERKGKPSKGHIWLRAYNRGNHVVIEVEDDGRGIDGEKIRKTLVEKGLENEEKVRQLTKEELLEYIFMPGFSTREEVGEVSGRGVGMDVVKNNISQLSGTIDVETWKDKGTRFTLTLPVTLAIIKALLITSNGRDYAIPVNSILEILSLPASETKRIERRDVIDLRGRTLPLLRLEEFFNLPRRKEPLKRLNIVVVGLAEHRLGILVDRFVGEQEVVIKPLGKLLRGIKGFSGAAELGNNRAVLILDTGEIILSTMKGLHGPSYGAGYV